MVEPMVKSQTVRLLDIFIYGPFLMYVSMNKNISTEVSIGLFTLGIGTSIYNANNYLKLR